MLSYIGSSPFPVIVTTMIVSCFVGDSYKLSFATISGKGDNPSYITIVFFLQRGVFTQYIYVLDGSVYPVYPLYKLECV